MRLQDGRLYSQAQQRIELASKGGALWTQGTTQLGVFPDSFDITAGPLGDAADAEDIGHDKAVVCYPMDEGGNALKVNVTVLDYTNFQASSVVQATAGASVGTERSLYNIEGPALGRCYSCDSVIACLPRASAMAESVEDRLLYKSVGAVEFFYIPSFFYTNFS